MQYAATSAISLSILHQRMDHVNIRTIKQMETQ